MKYYFMHIPDKVKHSNKIFLSENVIVTAHCEIKWEKIRNAYLP